MRPHRFSPFFFTGSYLFPNILNIFGGIGYVTVRLQYRCDKCARKEYRKLYEGCVQRSFWRRYQRRIYTTAVLGGGVNICHRWYAGRFQWRLDGESLRKVIYNEWNEQSLQYL